jgi:YggT family protein
MNSLYDILETALKIAYYVVLVHAITSWLISFQVLNTRQPLVAQFWYGLNALLEPVYSRIRSLLPRMSGIDVSPLIALFVIYCLQTILFHNQALFP